MTAEEFLVENAGNLTDAEYNAALSDLESLDRASWVAKYSPLMQEKAARWNEVDDVKKSKPLPTRISEAFGKDKFAPGKSYLEDVYATDFADVPRKEFDAALKKMRDYYDQFVSEQEKEAGRIRRQKEVKDWGLVKQALTSDYEKQRYIDDPEAALFGEEAPSLGSAENTRWGSMADLGLGAAGAAADALPGWGSMAGPVIRVGRDIGHRVTNSPYQKSAEDIAKDAIADVILTSSTAWMPNFRKEKRMVENALPEAMGNQMKLARESENIQKGVELLNKVVNGNRDDLGKQFGTETLNKYFRETVQELPDSYLKQDLLPLVTQPDIDWARAQAIVNDYKAKNLLAMAPNGYEAVHAIVDNNLPFPKASDHVIVGKDGKLRYFETPNTYDKLTMDIYNAKPLSPLQQKLMKPATALNEVLRGDVGGAAIQLGKTATGARSPKKAERVRTVEDQLAINRIKAQEERFWEAGFKPNKVEGDPLWEAYSEWEENRKKKDAIKQSLLRGK